MANQVFLIPLRNDVEGMGLQVLDQRPNSSQRNLIYDGEGRSGYISYSMDVPALSVTTDTAWVSGSKNTHPITVLILADTDGDLANDAMVSNASELGLEAYLREHVENRDLGGSVPLTPALAASCADAIRAIALAGTDLTRAALSTALSLVAGVTADFDGTVIANSLSFGSITELLRILAGEVYLVPRYTIMTDQLGDFLTLAQRQVLEAAQDAAVTYLAAGHFLVSSEAGYRNLREWVRTGSLNASMGEADGVLHELAAGLTFDNPLYAYTAIATTATRLRARNIVGTALASDTSAPVVQVYNHLGTALPE